MDASVGLCASCAHAVVQQGGRSRFWRCRRADSDPGFRRYPPLPVLRCAGHEEGDTLDADRGPRPARARGGR